MPDYFRFEHSFDRPDSTDSTPENLYYLDLLSEMRVVVGTWRETPQGNRVVTTCTLAKVDTKALIRTYVESTHRTLNTAVEYVSDPTTAYSIWFRWQTEGESYKRALVYSYQLEPLDHEVDDIHLTSGAGRYLLTFVRSAAFEEGTVQEVVQNGVSANGGVWNVYSTISGGGVPGRIMLLQVSASGLTTDFSKLWVGLRPVRGNVLDFDPVLNFTTSHSLGVTGVTNNTSDSNTAGGNYIRDDFTGGADMAFKLSYTFDYTVDQYVGRYLALLRCKIVSGSGICQARISTSFASPTYANPVALGNNQYLTNTAWKLIEMGEIEMPGGRVHNMLDIRSLRVNLETGRVSGDAVLGVDSIILIPSNHYVTWDKATFGNSANPDTSAWIVTYPDDSVEGYVAGDVTGARAKEKRTHAVAEIGGRSWAYPVGYLPLEVLGGQMVIAAEQASGHVVADDLNLTIEVRRRWKSYRAGIGS